jgi:ribosomal protein S18 acetylase RimI-like enzyme
VSQSSSMPTAVIVRPAGVPDAAGLARIRLAAWRAAYRGIVPAAVLDALDPDAETARWRTSLSTPRPAFTRVAIAGSPARPVGFVVAGPARGDEVAGFGEVYAIYVDPEVQGRGIGRALIEAGVRGLTARRFAEAILWVFEANAPARGFYEKMGWAADGAVKPFEIGGAAPLEVRYRRPLG